MTKSEITTDRAIEVLGHLKGDRRADLLRYMAFMPGTTPPLELFTKEVELGESERIRAAALFTMYRWHGADGLETYVSALADRSGRVSLSAAVALSRLGTACELQPFMAWAKRRFSRKNRPNSFDKHELAAAILFGHRTESMGQIVQTLRRYSRNLDPTEVQVLRTYAPRILDERDHADEELVVDVQAIVDWGDEQGHVLPTAPIDLSNFADYHLEYIRKLLR